MSPSTQRSGIPTMPTGPGASAALKRPYVRRGFDERLDAWMDSPENLQLIGADGVGRTEALRRLEAELAVRGVPCLWMRPSLYPWEPVWDALSNPALPRPRPMPVAHDPQVRSVMAAARLEDRVRNLVLLADDADGLDAGSLGTLRQLARRGRVVVVTTSERPLAGWPAESVHVAPLDPAQVGALVRAHLGGASPLDDFVSFVYARTDGFPGPVGELAHAAFARGVLVGHSGHWHLDDTRLDELVVPITKPPPEDALSPEGVAVGAVVGLAGVPVELGVLASLADVDADEASRGVRELVAVGLATVHAARVCAVDVTAASALAGLAGDPASVRHRIASWLLAQDPVRWHVVGWHLGGGSNAAVEFAPRCVAQTCALDPRSATALAETLWKSVPSPELGTARVQAIAAAGDVSGAVAFAMTQWDEDPGSKWVGLLAAASEALHKIGETERAVELAELATRAVGTNPLPVSLAIAAARAWADSETPERGADAAREAIERCDGDDTDQLTLYGLRARAERLRAGAAAALRVFTQVPEALGRGTAARAELEAEHSATLAACGRPRDACTTMAAAADTEALDALRQARMRTRAASWAFDAGHPRDALTLYELALPTLEALDRHEESGQIRRRLALAHADRGRWERAVEVLQTALSAGEAPSTVLTARLLCTLGDVQLARGAFALAQEAWDRAEGLTSSLGPAHSVRLARRHAELAVARGQPDALPIAQAAVERAATHGHIIEGCRSRALVAHATAREGVAQDLSSTTAEVTTTLLAASAPRALAEARLSLAAAWLEAGDGRAARELAERVVAYADAMGATPLRTRADALCALAGTHRAEEPVDRLLELSLVLARERHLPSMLRTVADTALSLLDAERAFVLLISDSGDPHVAAVETRDPGEEHVPVMSIVHQVITGRREVLAGDLDELPELRQDAAVRGRSLQWALCVPMVDDGGVLGAIYVDSQSRRDRDHGVAEAARVIRALAALAGVAVTNARQVALLEQRAALADEVAHDLLSPAHVVLCVADEILDDTLQPAEVARDLKGTGRMLLAMREQVLRKGSDLHRLQDLDLVDSMDRLTMQLARVARSEAKVLSFHADDAVWVHADMHDLARAVSNLVHNALRFTEPGGRVHLHVEGTPKHAIIRVRDHGPGLDDSALETVFQRGVRGDLAPGGHGLGLAIARRVAGEHGGTLDAHNHPDGGAEFRIELCRIEPPDRPACT